MDQQINQEQDQSQSVATQPAVNTQTDTGAKRPKNTKKITKIILGAVGLLVLIAAVLVYFLWWQNPNKMVGDAIASVLTADKMTNRAKVILTTPEIEVDSDIDWSQNDGMSKIDAKLSLKSEQISIDSINFKGVMEKDGVTYFRVDNLAGGVDVAIDALIDQQVADYEEDFDFSAEELDQVKQDARQQIKSIVDPMIEKIEGQWIKATPADASDNEETKCITDALQNLQSDKKLSREVMAQYDKNRFLIIKEEVAKQRGARGFKIDLNSKEAEENFRNFIKSLENTEFGKQLKNCDSDAFDISDDETGDSSDADSKVELTVWVDAWSHKMTNAEIKIDSTDDSDVKIAMLFDFNIGKAEAIEVPTGARDFEEVFGDMGLPFGPQSSEDFDQDSTVQSMGI